MNQSQSQTNSTSPSPQLTSSDWFLQMLVEMVNGSEVVFPVTLNVGGVLVSGEMVSGHKYFEGFAKDLKEGMFGTTSENANFVEDQFKKLGSIYIREEQGQDDERKPPPQYIHLRNARIFHPGGTPIPTNRGVWWRGRLEAVDGFILGTLSVG